MPSLRLAIVARASWLLAVRDHWVADPFGVDFWLLPTAFLRPGDDDDFLAPDLRFAMVDADRIRAAGRRNDAAF